MRINVTYVYTVVTEHFNKNIMSIEHTLKRSERIKMFLHEYYLGQSNIITLFRLIGGPLLIVFGIDFYQRNDRFAVAYGGFMFFYHYCPIKLF